MKGFLLLYIINHSWLSRLSHRVIQMAAIRSVWTRYFKANVKHCKGGCDLLQNIGITFIWAAFLLTLFYNVKRKKKYIYLFFTYSKVTGILK